MVATNRIGQVLRKRKVKSVFKLSSRIPHLLPSPKDRLNLLASKGVYSNLCSCGVVHVGETDLSMETRLYEHRRSVNAGLLITFAVAEQQHKTGNHIHYNSTFVLAESSFHFAQKIRYIPEISIEMKNSHW